MDAYPPIHRKIDAKWISYKYTTRSHRCTTRKQMNCVTVTVGYEETLVNAVLNSVSAEGMVRKFNSFEYKTSLATPSPPPKKKKKKKAKGEDQWQVENKHSQVAPKG